jgi:hypothetical protein
MWEQIIMTFGKALLLIGLAIAFYAENITEFVNKHSKKGKTIFVEKEEDKLEKMGISGKRWRMAGIVITALAILIDIFCVWRW